MASMQVLVTTPVLLEVQPVFPVEISVFYNTLYKALCRLENLKCYCLLRGSTIRCAWILQQSFVTKALCMDLFEIN